MLQPAYWTYDFSNLEFKNFGQVCSYDRDVIGQISRGYQYKFNTPTGLTADQLAITNGGAAGAAFTQDSLATTSKQGIWDNYYNQWKALTDPAKKEALDAYGLNAAPASTDNGAPTWQFANR